MNDEIFLMQLEGAFSTGYTIPQFCQDYNIKKPLFVAYNRQYLPTLWKFHTQFCYNKQTKITPTYSFLNDNLDHLDLSFNIHIAWQRFKKFDELNLSEFDKIIFLTANKFDNIKNAIYLDEIAGLFLMRAYLEIPLLSFWQHNPKVKLVIVTMPFLLESPHNTENEKNILAGKLPDIHGVRLAIEAAEGKTVATPYDCFGYTNKQVHDLLEVIGADTLPDGTTKLQDKPDGLVEIRNGKRVTAFQPKHYRNTIYFLGNCVYYGIGVPFEKTLESQLQKMLNENNLPYRVENESQPFNHRYQDLFYNLNKLPVKDNDIIFVCHHFAKSNLFPYFDTRLIFVRPHNYGEIFFDMCHVNELGHKALAENFFRMLVRNNFFQNVEFKYPAPPPPPHRYGIPKENFYITSNLTDNKDLQAYKQKLRDKRLPIGAIVMNCNPFTFGHKYLIEYAAARVYRLYIFVVEEDKSEFKFADRFELVKRGVEEFPNVEIIPSGQFIISQKTFSGYFNKENLQNVAVDSTQDVEIFAREIAPTLGINIRFVGEELEDTVTHQYNDNMKNILPRYGIDFYEIPRKEINGEVISAKRVRAALKVGDFEKIAKLVPKTTLEFLRKNYNKTAPPPN